MSGQLPLFAGVDPEPAGLGPAPAAQAHAELARALPPGLRLGTSSWSFPGWAGVVYDREASSRDLARHGLRAYAQHPLLRAVGVDRTFYGPVAPDVFADYAAQVPADFRFLVKAHQDCVVPALTQGAASGQRNPRFLDPVYAREHVVEPARAGLGPKLGVLLFQFPPFDVGLAGGARDVLRRLEAFFAALPEGLPYAVELRNRGLFGPRYLDRLAGVGVRHCLTAHPSMPPVFEQWRAVGPRGDGATVLRWMLARGLSYAAAKEAFAPFDRLARPDPETREQVAAVIRESSSTLVIVNNKAEGSSPCTLLALARHLAGEAQA
ncbi:MAG: DUF72 domain-containing protein [Planctomycetes bacterium]|nr:DUF72 domain-containing protein [Planctomycetota bacterium]